MMKKLIDYTCEFSLDNPDGTVTDVEFQPMPGFMEAAVRAEKYVDELPLGRTQRKDLYRHIRRLLDHAIEDAYLQT